MQILFEVSYGSFEAAKGSMLKILQASLQQYVNQELPEVQVGFGRVRETREQIANIHCITEKPRELHTQKPTSSLSTLKSFTVWITANCGKLLKRWEYQTTLPVSWETCVQVNKQQLELYMEKMTGSKLGKEYAKTVYCHPIYLTYLQSISCKMPDWINDKLEARRPGEASVTSDMQMMPL